VRHEKECVCSVCLLSCNILISGKIIKEMPGSVARGTLYVIVYRPMYKLQKSNFNNRQYLFSYSIFTVKDF
jgi:hypothetical protein